MPYSYTESNRLHASNQRRQEFEDKLMEYREEQALEAEIDSIIEEVYGNDECGFDCQFHDDDCDGFCDHSDHWNACLG